MLIAIGTNHKHSPVEVREKLAFTKRGLLDALPKLLHYPAIKAGVIISTCNRVELYASTLDIDSGVGSLKNFLAGRHQQTPEAIAPYLYTYIGKEALRHLCCVTCGLDSQIVGEHQILEQVASAYEEARISLANDQVLDFAFRQATAVAQRVRQETGIASGNISLAGIVLGLIKANFSCLEDKTIFVLGVGKISESIAQCLGSERVRTVFISNRHYEKAAALAAMMRGKAVQFEKLKENLAQADIIISATSSPHLILIKEDILEAISHKPLAISHQPLLIIDLAVPRDIDPEVKYIKGVSLFCLDDLDSRLEKILEKRKQEVPKALAIIEQEVNNLCLPRHLEWAPEPALLP